MEQSKVITTSGKGQFDLRDVAKGLIVAVVTPIFTIITNSLEAGTLTFDWKSIIGTAIAAGLAYLAKNFFTASQTIIKN